MPAQPGGPTAAAQVTYATKKDPIFQKSQYAVIFLIITILTVILYGVLAGLVNPPAPRTRPEAVLTLMESAVKEQPGNGKAWAAYAEALYASGDKEKAFQVLRDARKKVKDDTITPALTSELHLLLLEGRNADVVKRSTGYIQIEIDLRAQKARINKAKGIAVTIDRQDNSSLVNLFIFRAMAEDNLKDAKNAAIDFTNALKLNPQAADVQVMRGWARLRAGDKKGAKKDFENALQFLPNDPSATQGLKALKVNSAK